MRRCSNVSPPGTVKTPQFSSGSAPQAVSAGINPRRRFASCGSKDCLTRLPCVPNRTNRGRGAAARMQDRIFFLIILVYWRFIYYSSSAAAFSRSIRTSAVTACGKPKRTIAWSRRWGAMSNKMPLPGRCVSRQAPGFSWGR